MINTRVILAGQSNALGFRNNVPAPYTPTSRVQIWCDTNGDGVPDNWNYMLPGHNTGTPANPDVWGAEVQFANRWLQAHAEPDVLWIVKGGCVKGSTGLAEDDAANVLDWSPESPAELFATAKGTAAGAMANLGGSPYAFTAYDALLWMQGETDAADATKANNYDPHLRDFLSKVRDPALGWGLAGRVCIGRISDSPALPFSLPVRLAQWSVFMDDPHNSPSFATKDFPRWQDDNIHYTAPGHVMLGDAFYQAFVGP